MTIRNEIFNYLNTNWDQTPTIAWVNSNVTFVYSASIEYIVPSLRLAYNEVMEIPYDEAIVRRDYILGLNLLVKDNTGIQNVDTYTARLSALFHKKTVSTTSYSFQFEALEVSQGFGSGSHFEVPVLISFYVFSS